MVIFNMVTTLHTKFAHWLLMTSCILMFGYTLSAPMLTCSSLHAEATQCESYWQGLDGELPVKPPLLVISLDGFRADYYDRLNSLSLTNGIVRLAECGTKAESMIPVFPTITLPNHYSIVTGLYPESHGIVAHEFYDPIIHRNFSLPAVGFDFSAPNLLDPVWWTGEPIWYTIKKQGKKSAAYFWPGSFIDDPDRRPDYWMPYNSTVPFDQRIKEVLDWLLLPVERRPSFIALYLNEPDSTGHDRGPDSAQVEEQIKYVDSQIEYLIERLASNGILGCVDIIVLSDHGMVSVPLGQNVLQLEDVVDDIRTTAYCFDCAEGATSTLRPVNDTQVERDRIASGMECRNEEVRVYDKMDFPRRHHYANSPRISSLLFEMSNTWRAVVGQEDYLPGNHGWDNLNPEMQALFVAQGPSFRRDGAVVPPFHNIDLYNLMCWLTGVNPAPNNGTWGALHHLLLTKPPAGNHSEVGLQEILPYPMNEKEYVNRLEQRQPCELLSAGQNSLITDSSLNLTESQVQSSLALNCPWGSPGSNDESIKVLVSHDSVIGFDVKYGIPAWVSYTVASTNSQLKAFQLTWRYDMRLRIGDNSTCNRLANATALLAPLFFPQFSSSAEYAADGLVETNAIDISPSFSTYWLDMETRIAHFAANHSGLLNVIAGPVRYSASPAVFIVISYCHHLLTNCSSDGLQVQSFILPTHLRYSRDCLSVDSFARSHLATVRDVERATGLTLFPQLPYEAKIQLLEQTLLANSLLIDPRPPSSQNKDTNHASSSLMSSSRTAVWLLLAFSILISNQVARSF